LIFSIEKKGATFLDFKAIDVAKQLTMIDLNIFKKITPQELSHQSWSKENSSPNVARMIEQSNEVKSLTKRLNLHSD
jgi:hypothetical protein